MSCDVYICVCIACEVSVHVWCVYMCVNVHVGVCAHVSVCGCACVWCACVHVSVACVSGCSLAYMCMHVCLCVFVHAPVRFVPAYVCLHVACVCMRIWVFTCVYVHACVPVYVCAPVCRVPAYTCLRVVCVYMRVWMCPCVVCASPSRTLQLACDTCLSLGVPELKVPVRICFRWKEAPFPSCSVLLSGWVPDASVGADFHSGPVYGTLCRAGRESSLSCRRSGAVFIDTCGFDILYSDAVEPFLQNRSWHLFPHLQGRTVCSGVLPK